jgi:hypothetical protein
METKQTVHWAVADAAEQLAPAKSINLGPALRARRTASVGRPLTPAVRVASGVVLLALAGLVFVPGARAFTEAIFQRLGLAFVDTAAFGTEGESAEAVPAIPPSEPVRSLSLEELRAQVPFIVLAPTEVPAGLDYVRREVSDVGSGLQVYLTYGRTPDYNYDSGLLMLIASQGPISAPPLLAASREQAVTVNGQPGIYAHGGWQNNGQGDPATRFGDLLWDDTIDSAYLTWAQEGVTYLLQAHGLGLGEAELIAVAEGME